MTIEKILDEVFLTENTSFEPENFINTGVNEIGTTTFNNLSDLLFIGATPKIKILLDSVVNKGLMLTKITESTSFEKTVIALCVMNILPALLLIPKKKTSETIESLERIGSLTGQTLNHLLTKNYFVGGATALAYTGIMEKLSSEIISIFSDSGKFLGVPDSIFIDSFKVFSDKVLKELETGNTELFDIMLETALSQLMAESSSVVQEHLDTRHYGNLIAAISVAYSAMIIYERASLEPEIKLQKSIYANFAKTSKKQLKLARALN
jgi:hypothetical protein